MSLVTSPRTGFERYGTVLIDIDGTLLLSERALPGAVEWVEACRAWGAKVLFVTNMSLQTREHCHVRLVRAAIEADVDEVLTAAMAVAAEVRRRNPALVAYCGGPGLVRELERLDVPAVPFGELDVASAAGTDDAVLVLGMVPSLTRAEIDHAADLVRAGWPVLASSWDRGMPVDGGIMPGTGQLLRELVKEVDVQPTICGKPGGPMATLAAERCKPGRPVLVVGDTLDADIGMAAVCGWDSVLVLTGMDGVADLGPRYARPTWITRDLAALLSGDADHVAPRSARRPTKTQPAKGLP